MSKLLIIKGADFSVNAIGKVDYTVQDPSAPQPQPAIRFSRTNLAVPVEKLKLVMYAPGVAAWNDVLVAALDVSRYVGRQLHISSFHTGFGAYMFIADTTSLGPNRDINYIENWDPAAWTQRHDVFNANIFGDYCLVNEVITGGVTEVTVTVPTGAKWILISSRAGAVPVRIEPV